MSSFQNPNPKYNPNPYPAFSNQYPHPKPAPASVSKDLTFDDVSKFFSLPLSDAADSLGVCTSVLKKICYDNGLVRWPYRKVRAGKSIEDIKGEAAREKAKHVNGLSNISRQMNNASASSTGQPYVRASQVEDKSAISVQDFSKPTSVLQQQGNKTPHIGNPQKLHGTSLPKETPANADEFKYGFPSEGLATVSYRWWGNSNSNATKGVQDDVSKDIQEHHQTPKKPLDSVAVSSTMDVKNDHSATGNSSDDHPGGDSLSALRSVAVKEGREALKLGIRRRYNLNKLDEMQKDVLHLVFKSSLPSEWIDESS